MTQTNKLIVGGIVVLVAFYLYDRNRKMKAKEDLKAGAEISSVPDYSAIEVGTGGIKSGSINQIVKNANQLKPI